MSARILNGSPSDRSTKKVKFRSYHDSKIEMEVEDTLSEASYMDKLLTASGHDSIAWVGNEYFGEEELPEDHWYKGVPEQPHEIGTTFNPCPGIHVSDEELDNWNSAWKNVLIIHVLGKTVSFKIIEAKVNIEWAKEGRIRIIDMPSNYYVVQFSSPEDYRHTLYDSPWMSTDHYILVQRWRLFFLTNAQAKQPIAV